MLDVTFRKEDALNSRQIRVREQRVVGIKASPKPNVPEVFCTISHCLVTLLLRQVRKFDSRLNYRKGITEKAIQVCAKGFR